MIRLRGAWAGLFLVLASTLAPPPGGRVRASSAAAQAPAQPPRAETRGVRLAPDPGRLAAAPPHLAARLRDDAFDYFRFLNRPWAQRVCEAFADDLRSAPAASLHGDAHVEQYAFTSTARGLDDFDDSAQGPIVIDVVRFLGSIELVARGRGWDPAIDALFDSFLDGYRKGLADSGYLPPDPPIVRRLRPLRARDQGAFLAFAESLMVPLSRTDRRSLDASLRRLDRLMRGVNPALPARYFRIRKGGWASLGVGSALTPKVLLRVEGPTASRADDLIVEGKQLSDLRGVSCLELPKTAEALRVISGTEAIGRLRHDVLAVVPRLPGAKPGPDWWVRSWDPSYGEVSVRDFGSVEELADVVHDAGAQLGAGAVRGDASRAQAQARQLALETLERLDTKARAVAHALVEELLAEWSAFRTAGRE